MGKPQFGMNWKLGSPWNGCCLCLPLHVPSVPSPCCSQLFWAKWTLFPTFNSQAWHSVFAVFLRAWSTLIDKQALCHSHGHLPVLKTVCHMSLACAKSFQTRLYPRLMPYPNKFVTGSLLAISPAAECY